MKSIEIRNRDNSESVERNGYSFSQMTSSDVLSAIGAMQVDIQPGNKAFSYHYHEGCEEIFYIVSGKGSIRTEDGDVDVKGGDFISFSTGKESAHVIRNTGDDVLTYINFHNTSKVDVGYFPDRKQVMIFDSKGMNFYPFDDQ